MMINNVVLKQQSLKVVVPTQQLVPGSLQAVVPHKRFADWTGKDHRASYRAMQAVARCWERQGVANQYLIYGKNDSMPFHWEMVPYQTCYTCLGRIIQQLQVLWRVVFGGVRVSEKTLRDQVESYTTQLQEPLNTRESLPSSANDAFCNQETIQSQWVIQGKRINVLFNYAPIGFGGEKLHFLVVPRQHREAFTDVTEKEYGEALQLTHRLIDRISKTRNIKTVHFLNKTGVDAGQTVKHWHLHVVFSSNAAQDFFGKLTVFKNILIGSSPMSKEALAKKVAELRAIF